MNISDYRREYASFHFALQEEKYRQHQHPTPDGGVNLRHVFERYADLHTPDAIHDLEEKLKDASALGTEREGLQKLCAEARIRNVEGEAREAEEELRRGYEAARVEWMGASLTAQDVSGRIVRETSAAARRELAARRRDALRSCHDLKLARDEILNGAARRFDSDSYLALRHRAEGVNVQHLLAASQELMERTESLYYKELALSLARYLPGMVVGEATYADALFFKRAAQFDVYFRADGAAALYRAAVSSLGIAATGHGQNIGIEEGASLSPAAPSACFAVSVPDRVRLVVSRAAGASVYAEALGEGGRAQHFGWTSRDMSARHPEFVYGIDGATNEGHAALFRHLFLDPLWLAENLGNLRPSRAGELSRFFALTELHDLRSCAARLQIEAAATSAPEADEQSFAQMMSQATGFQHPPGALLRLNEETHTATSSLRARMFAAHLRELLRTRHGSRWWASRGARDELIDIWNTGSRYAVEELARLTGAGELSDFDLLIEMLTKALDEE